MIMMVVIFVASSFNGQQVVDYGFESNNLRIGGHFILFMFLCVSFYKATKSIYKSVVYTVFYAFLDEFHQRFVPLRSSSMFDIYVDTLGALISGVFLWKLLPLLPSKLKSLLQK